MSGNFGMGSRKPFQRYPTVFNPDRIWNQSQNAREGVPAAGSTDESSMIRLCSSPFIPAHFASSPDPSIVRRPPPQGECPIQAVPAIRPCPAAFFFADRVTGDYFDPDRSFRFPDTSGTCSQTVDDPQPWAGGTAPLAPPARPFLLMQRWISEIPGWNRFTGAARDAAGAWCRACTCRRS